MASGGILLRGGQKLLARTFINILPRFVSRHRYAKLHHDAGKHCACVSPAAPSTTISAAASPRNSSKRIHIVQDDVVDTADAAVFALRLRNAKDFQSMLSASGLLCLVPASQDAATKSWRFSGEGTRCYSDLRENAFYMTMRAVRQCGSPDRSLKQVRNELQNRARGEEGELTEALLSMFTKEAGFPNMVSKQELRTVENEEVDAVLVSTRAVVIGFHCNKLTLREAAGAFTRVSKWSNKARKGSPSHSFLLGKALYVVLSANFLPIKETQQVISFCKRHNLIILLRNGTNFSMHNSLLPKQQIVPANVQVTKSNPQ